MHRELLKTGNYDIDPKFTKALKLGIEALKRIDNIRNVGNVMPGSLLPGETEE